MEFFAAGLRNGLRVAFVGSGGMPAARTQLAGLGDLDRLLAAGAVQILSADDVYAPGGPVDPDAVVATLAAATEAALADGFRGLRVSADTTDLIRTPRQRDAFIRYEVLVDRYMAAHPLSAMCGYRLDLGEETVSELAAVHALEPSAEPGFRVFGCADGAVGLEGEFDPAGVAVLHRVLARLGPGPDGAARVVDLAGVEYVDHRLLLALADHARADGLALTMRSAPPFAARLMDLLPAPYLRRAGSGVE